MPELVKDGVNGRLVDTVAEAAEAAAKLGSLSPATPATVRASVVDRFSDDRMVDDYLNLYRQILSTRSRSALH
jgi:glycosyltransferase involved in cell wall biosynthesis